MIKNIFTIVLLTAFHAFAFGQVDASANVDSPVERVSKTVDEKSDITGTITNAGGWNIYVDDAKTTIEGKVVKKIADSDMQTLVRKGFSFAKESKAKNTCYRYRIVAKKDGSQEMLLYDCPF